MPSKRIYSPGTGAGARPRSVPPETPGEIDPLTALAVQSQLAADQLLASIDWDAYDAAMTVLAAQSERATSCLLHDAFPAGTLSAGALHTGDDPT